jgi:fatty acid desaturase
MTPKLHSDVRLQQIKWKDLLVLSRKEIAYEILLSLPWLIGSLIFAYYSWYMPALICSFFFFLTGLRQSHNAQHNTVGISKRATEWFLFGLSATMLASMHAVKYNHLQHHKHPLTTEDIEAMSARMPWWKAFLAGPYFILRIHQHAMKYANKHLKQWILFEIILITLILLFTYFIIDIHWITYHVTVMIIGECCTSFFAVWTVHHDCEPESVYSRTVRGRWKSILFYNMFYHTEHHLFPKVPTCHLPDLAKRIDDVIPEIQTKSVL